MGPNKYVQLMFAAGALLAAFLLAKTGDWVWSYFAKPNDLAINGVSLLIGVVAGWALYRNERVFTAAQDITRELEKVTWPTRKETSNATVVVLVTVIIAALILSGMDAVWSALTGRILS
jgi:preprotein translocase subunit SecE